MALSGWTQLWVGLVFSTVKDVGSTFCFVCPLRVREQGGGGEGVSKSSEGQTWTHKLSLGLNLSRACTNRTKCGQFLGQCEYTGDNCHGMLDASLFQCLLVICDGHST